MVILGQDPYHGDGQAHGLCFSVKPDVEIPPSLVNIYKELHDDCGCYIPDNGCLTKWTNQGVLLLNTVLTVRAHQANSHRGIGWEEFTDAAIRILNEQDRPIVFILWGRCYHIWFATNLGIFKHKKKWFPIGTTFYMLNL